MSTIDYLGDRVKYDRPVWQLMHACADAMPERFRYSDVRAWFEENFPEVGESTIRAHIVGLTEGGASKHPQFQPRSPLFVRVERGVYSPIPLHERGETPTDDDESSDVTAEPETQQADVGAVPAADRPWVSALLGALPGEDLGPDDIDEAPIDASTSRPDAIIVSSESDDLPAASAETPGRGSLDEWRRARPESSAAEPSPEIETSIPDESETTEDQRRAHDQEIKQSLADVESQRTVLAAERAEMAKVSAERTAATDAAAQSLEQERTRLADQQDHLRQSVGQHERVRAAALQALEAERLRMIAQHEQVEREVTDQAHDEVRRLSAERARAEDAAAAEVAALDQAVSQLKRHRDELSALGAERVALLRQEADRAEKSGVELGRLRSERDELEQAVRREQDAIAELRESVVRARAVVEGLQGEVRALVAAEEAERELIEVTRAQQQHERDHQLARDAAERVRIEMEAAEQAELERLEQAAETERATRKADHLKHEEREHLQAVRDVAGAAPAEPSIGGAYIVRAPRIDPVITPAAPAAPPEASDGRPDAIVIGSAGEQVRVPVPAKDAYRDIQFQLNRFDAETSGVPWGVLSPDHGLLEPDEWVSPDDRPAGEVRREAWAAWVVARLESWIGDLDGATIQIAAPDQQVELLTSFLHDKGVRVTTKDRRATQDGPSPTDSEEVDAQAGLEPAELDGPPDTAEPSPVVSPLTSALAAPTARELASADAEGTQLSRDDAVHGILTDPDLAIPASAARGLPHQPGLYAWLVDDDGAQALSEALDLEVDPGVLYVGQVGAPNGIGEVVGSLNDHVNLVQLYGSARSSAFRMNLATALAEPLELVAIDDSRLTRWMLAHLSVAVWPSDDVAVLSEVKAAVMAQTRAPFNLESSASDAMRARLEQLRNRLA